MRLPAPRRPHNREGCRRQPQGALAAGGAYAIHRLGEQTEEAIAEQTETMTEAMEAQTEALTDAVQAGESGDGLADLANDGDRARLAGRREHVGRG